MVAGDKVTGSKRRKLILSMLKKSNDPLSGKKLAENMGVSRQVIVQDVSLLKAKGEPIIATARGYILFKEGNDASGFTRVIAVSHGLEDTVSELYTLVDHGVTIKNVMVEHPIYGDLTGSLMIKNRHEVDEFVKDLKKSGAALLSDLTNGVHLHTIEAATEEQLKKACAQLEELGILLK
ncbi:transcription repressor NadR [Virgibacillus kekensis]|uniref:Transcription repressor NadR n=1 Tax=Virgibacillus kekensis TaxID=202261 RepID=A0ABV9DJQ1_9BACI